MHFSGAHFLLTDAQDFSEELYVVRVSLLRSGEGSGTDYGRRGGGLLLPVFRIAGVHDAGSALLQ